jgi:hypothetical protein
MDQKSTSLPSISSAKIALLQSGHFLLKTFNIELQRIKALAHNNGFVYAQIDALVTPGNAAQADGKPPTTLLSMSEDNARVLLQLIKAQLSELDKRKARSRRG